MTDYPAARFKELVQRRDVAALRALLDGDPSARSLVNEPIFSFDSPALVFLSTNDANADLVALLLQYGADPNRKSEWWAGGFHSLYGARGAIADQLLNAGAVPDACAAAAIDRPDLLRDILRADAGGVHERGGDGQTPLHFAKSREVIDILLDAGADIEARDVDHRATAAEWMLDGRIQLSRYLVMRGASADIFLAAALGLTERVVAMLEEDPTLREMRVSEGAYGEKPPSSYHIYHWVLGAGLRPIDVAAKFKNQTTAEAIAKFAR